MEGSLEPNSPATFCPRCSLAMVCFRCLRKIPHECPGLGPLLCDDCRKER